MRLNDDGAYEILLNGRQLCGVLGLLIVAVGGAFQAGRAMPATAAPAHAPTSAKAASKPALLPSARAQKPDPTAVIGPPAPAVSVTRPAPPKQVRPATGVYLQVTAGGPREIAALFQDLTNRGFHAVQAPVEGRVSLFRLMVGPFADEPSISQARVQLTLAGLEGNKAIIRRM